MSNKSKQVLNCAMFYTRFLWCWVTLLWATACFTGTAAAGTGYTVKPRLATDTTRWRLLEKDIRADLGKHNDTALAKSKRIVTQATAGANKKWMARGNYLTGWALYLQKKYDDALPYLQKAVGFDVELNDNEFYGDCLYRLAAAYYRLEKNDEAIQWFEKGLPVFKKENQSYNQANSYMYLGNIYYNTQVNDKALDAYGKAAPLFIKLGETYFAGDVYYNMANIYYFREKKYQDALDNFILAEKYYAENNEVEYRAYCNFYIGDIGFYYIPNNESAIAAYEKALKYYVDTETEKKVAYINKNLADIYDDQENYEKALSCLNETIRIYEKNNEYVSLGDAYIVKANIVYFQGDYVTAYNAFQKSLTNYEKGGSYDGMAGSYVGLGNLYHSKKDEAKALEMYNKSLEYYEKGGNKHYSGISGSYTGIGNIYYSEKNYDKALEYYEKGIEFDEKSNNTEGKVVKLMNISNIYTSRDDHAKAEEYLNKSMEENEKGGNRQRKSAILSMRGFLYKKKGEYDKAIEDCNAALTIAENLGLKPQIMECYNCLYGANYLKGDYEKALSSYYMYIGARDSINNEKLNQEITRQHLQYEYEMRETNLKNEQEKKQIELQEEIKRKQMAYQFEQQQASMRALAERRELQYHEEMKRKQLAMDFEKQQNLSKLEAERKQNRIKLEKERQELLFKKDLEQKRIQNEAQKKITYWLIAGLSLMCVLAFFIYRGYREKRKANAVILEQKKEVENQKEEIVQKSLLLEEKNKEILDSINYAKRLQEAILPPVKLVREYLKDSFILYKPKDIVAGDFYWMEQRDGLLLFAAADCTGHGVPGAMVSVVCSNALDRAVKEFGITEPGKILDKVRELVIETFVKSESEVKDGMDISLCALETGNPKSEMTLQWAGANNPLWILRKGAEELEEIRADKQPIGVFAGATPFTTHKVMVNPGDSIYIFTDGYADQFGGEKGKKFKASNMKKLILMHKNEPMEIQNQRMNEYFETWRGSLEQIDDVCMMGVRF